MYGDDEQAGSGEWSRRHVLGAFAAGVVTGGGAVTAWFRTRPDERPADPESTPEPTPEPTPDPTPADTPEPTAPAIVQRYAPDLYFGRLEKWFPTDPTELLGPDDSVLDGFDALDGYTAAFTDPGAPPWPTVFYNVVEDAGSPGIDAVQYWMYSAFDQFTVNFHWHDWELLQVFVDRETGTPLLLSASAHSRKVPNNEYADPPTPEERRPAVLSEVGSHSSASETNAVVPTFERLPSTDWDSDITNGAVDVSTRVRTPFAYGLPRDEGARLPFVMPELDGRPLDEHPDLSVDREDFIDERATVGSWNGLPRPPAEVPVREPGLVLTAPESRTDGGITYALEPMARVRGAISDFVGPQLSFEFAVPGFVEDRLASHITSVGIPWEQPRFSDPLADVTDPEHRRSIAGDAPSGLADRVVGRVRQLRAGGDGAAERVSDDARSALANRIPVSLFDLPVEAAVRLASPDPVATVTRGGVFGLLRVERGDHLLVVNGPGYAPVAERFDHDGGLVRAGAGGELTVVASEDAATVRGDGRAAGGIERVRVVEDYAGTVYDGRPVEPDRYTVPVHRAGTYTVEVVNGDGRRGAYRVTPADFGDADDTVRETVETGKASLARSLAGFLGDLRGLSSDLAEGDGARGQVLELLSSARTAVEDAVAAAEEGATERSNDRLRAAVGDLQRTREVLQGSGHDGYSDSSVAALDPRISRAIEDARVAIETSLE